MSNSSLALPSVPPPPHFNAKTNPAVLLIIIILAVVFFISGLLHLLARFITRNRSSSSSSSGNSSISLSDLQNPETFQIQGQLQQLFTLHDSGLDQSFIDALPLFQYKEISGLKEPFDCAVCLAQFLEDDKLRLLPICSHAFHIECIDTWLLSNSTCPLCRGSLCPPEHTIRNPVFEFENWTEEGFGNSNRVSHNVESNEVVEISDEEKMVLPVKLGKFKSSNVVHQYGVETSSSNFDGRRCFSMGSYQYVVAESELQVALSSSNRTSNGGIGRGRVIDMDVKGKKINMGSKNESFSVSKIWLWSSKNPKFPASSPNTHDIGNHPGFGISFPWNNVD